MNDHASVFLIWAILLGAASAVSLPIGSMLALTVPVRTRYVSILAAFGAGALIAALSVELVAPTLFALELSHGAAEQQALRGFISLTVGAVCGGLIFTLLDGLVNRRGGFLRRYSSTINYLTARRHQRRLAMLQELAAFPLLKDFLATQVNTLVTMLEPISYPADQILFSEGAPGTALFFITSGSVAGRSTRGLSTEFGPGNILGLIPMIMDTPHPGSLITTEPVTGYQLSKQHTEHLAALSPDFAASLRSLTVRRAELLESLIAERDAKSVRWLQTARNALQTGAEIPNSLQLHQLKETQPGAPLAIWLGMLIDGIPESFVIGVGLLLLVQSAADPGTLTFLEVIPFTLIAGLALSNFPEAFASSANMLQQGWGKRRIFLLWFALMLTTAVGAGLGYLLADNLSPAWLTFAQGLAAGSMLTMIAAAMIPDAVHLGNANTVGLSTLAGFLAAICFKLLEV